MISFHETGLLAFSWPVLPLTLLWLYLWGAIAVAIVLKQVGYHSVRHFLLEGYFGVFASSLGVDALLVLILWLLSDCVKRTGSTYIGRCLLIVLVVGCGTAKYMLYGRIVLVNKNLGRLPHLNRAAVSLAALTTPWMFLVPAEVAYAWVGRLLMFLGGVFSTAGTQ